jgi:hypothetical protein
MKSASGKLVFIKLTVIAAAVILAIFGFNSYSAKYEKVSASATGPSTSHTNAPGEANCTECHSDFSLNSGTGGITISGVPAFYVPNQSFNITVTTSQSDAVIYGFQMTAIDNLGRQVGSYTLPNQNPAQLQTMDGVVDGITRKYIHHTSDGVIPTMFGSKSWTFSFTAPPQRVGKISFYAAGNAANSDGGTSGDYIYATSKSALSSTQTVDFDGDNKTDLSIYRPSVGEWWYLKSSNGGNAAFQFGNSADKIMPRDFTGDGKTDVAIWRPSTGEWFILRSEDFSYYSFPFGTNGDVPAAADFDDDGKADQAVFRPSDTNWYIRRSSDSGFTIQQFGASGDVPVPADFDGDGKADIAIYRPSLGQWWLKRSSNQSIEAFTFGNSADKPVQGDYTGDGKADVAIWRPSTGEWFILRSDDFSYYSFPFGTTGDIPAPGDYDGDRKFDATVFRPSNSMWFVQRTTAGTLIQTFGITNDIPVPGN